MGDFGDLDSAQCFKTMPNVHFVPIAPPLTAKIINAANRRGLLTYSFYLAYRIWHKKAGVVARQLVNERVYDVLHYLGPIGYREPGTLWKIDLPYVWGPIGGANNLPFRLFRALPLGGRVKLGFRAVINWLQLRLSMRVRRALVRADVLITATTENFKIFRRVLGVESFYFPENGVIGEIGLDENKFYEIEKFNLIWIGSIDSRKALRVLILALKRMQHAHRFKVHIVGDGPQRTRLQSEVILAGMADQFLWHGQIERAKVRAILNSAHLHVVTSVSEGNPTTIWEAMALGVPTLTIDHCGMRDSVGVGAGLKVRVGEFDEIVSGFAHHLDAIAKFPDQLRHMAYQALKDGERYHWKHRPKFWLKIYSTAITRYRSRNGQ
jgi:glycosyltransferase involved in cell wall biosynthesis